jgi:hypothetical protein
MQNTTTTTIPRLSVAFMSAMKMLRSDSAVASVGIEWVSPEGNSFTADVFRDIVEGELRGDLRNVKRVAKR